MPLPAFRTLYGHFIKQTVGVNLRECSRKQKATGKSLASPARITV